MSRIKGITIELGGDTSKLDKAIRDVTSSTKSLDKELRGINYGLRLDPKNTELLAQKQKVLAERVEKSAEKVELLKQKHELAGKQFASGEITDKEFRAISKELGIAEGELKKFESELAEVSKSLKNVGKSWQQTGDKIVGVGKSMSTKVTAPIVGVGAAAMLAWGEIDDALDGIALATGATGDSMDDFEKVFRRVYGSVPGTADDASQAIGEVNTQFGSTGDELGDLSEQFIKYAKITDQEVSPAVIGVKKAMEVFGLEVEDTGDALDVLAKASQDTGVSTDQLQEAVRKNGAQLKGLNLSFEESVVLMSQMEKAGVDSSTAMGYMSRATVTLAKEGKTLKEGLTELQENLAGTESQTDKVTMVAEIFGTRAAPLMLDAIERGALDFDAFAESVGAAGGTVEGTFEQILDPADRAQLAFDNLKLVGYDLGTTIQEALTPAIEWLVEKIQGLTEWFQSLSPEIQTTIVTVAGIIAAIGPLLIILGTVIKVGGSVMAAISGIGGVLTALASPVGIAIVAIGGLIAAGVALWQNWDEVKAFAASLWESIKEIFAGIASAISGAWNSVTTATANAWNSVKSTVSSIASGISTSVSNVFNGIKTNVSGAWNSIKTATTNAWNSVKSAITTPINSAKTAVSNAIAKVKEILSGTLSFPKVSLPRFSITGRFSLKPLQVPRLGIEWYDKGGVFSAPAIIGVGEKRPEFVGALEDLRYLIGDELDKRTSRGSGEVNITVGDVHIHDDRDVDDLMREIAWRIRKEMTLEPI